MPKVLKEPVLEEANVVEIEPQTEQINLFAFQNEIEQATLLDDDSDGFITGDEEVFTPKLAVGTRVYYEDRVLEILDYLYDGNTVEIGDIEQLKGLNTFKARERVPATFLDKCTVMENHYSDGELANLIVDAAENEDKSKETLETIKAASIINQTEQAFNHNLAMDFIDRVQSGTLNYSYSPEHNLYDGGAKTKCKANIEAIKLLKRLEETSQPATSEQQIILAGYVGFGGLANALTPNKSGWESEYAEIKALLTEAEFKSAEESTTTAYFTEQMIIENIYKALSRFGFRGGNILDPAMGTGNFYSALPENMKDSNLFGVELDSITGRIAQKLYPTAEIELKGFEETNYPDQFFDVAIGNIPFNNIQLSDKRYDKYNFKIHDYFIAKSLDKVRPGGVVAFITSKGTLDKANQNVRKYIAQRAELIGAIRLPNTAFKQVAGTEVTSDILFFQKRERDIVPNEENTPWLAVSRDDNDIPMNQYFIDHPEMILGEMVFDESMYGSDKTTACHAIQGDDLSDRLDQAIHYLDCNYEEATSEFEDEKESSKDGGVPALLHHLQKAFFKCLIAMR
ncbi:MAG: N-6 DNA methylase [Faecalibacterium sp.]